MRRVQWLSPAVARAVVVLLFLAFSPSALAGPIRDTVEKRLPAGRAAREARRMHSPSIFWEGVAAAGAGTLFVVGGAFCRECVPSWPGYCHRKTEWAPMAVGMSLVSAGVLMMVVGGRHESAASLDVTPIRVTLRVRF